MKTNFTPSKITVLLFLLTGLLLTSCKKTTVGPTGATGATGETGATGPQGATGATGNANVRSFIFSTSSWSGDTICKSFTYKYHTTAIDANALENGAIILYHGDNVGDNTNQWTPMPLMLQKLQFSFSIELSTVIVTVTSVDGRMPVNPGPQKFKLVIIPPAS